MTMEIVFALTGFALGIGTKILIDSRGPSKGDLERNLSILNAQVSYMEKRETVHRTEWWALINYLKLKVVEEPSQTIMKPIEEEK